MFENKWKFLTKLKTAQVVSIILYAGSLKLQITALFIFSYCKFVPRGIKQFLA